MVCSPFVPLCENWGSSLKIWCNRSTVLQACCRSYCTVSDLFDVHERVVRAVLCCLLASEDLCLACMRFLSSPVQPGVSVLWSVESGGWVILYILTKYAYVSPHAAAAAINKPVLITESHNAPRVNPTFCVFGSMYMEDINVFHPPPKSAMLPCRTTTAAALRRAALVSAGVGVVTQRGVLCLDFNTDSLPASSSRPGRSGWRQVGWTLRHWAASFDSSPNLWNCDPVVTQALLMPNSQWSQGDFHLVQEGEWGPVLLRLGCR